MLNPIAVHLTENEIESEWKRVQSMKRHWEYFYGEHPKPLVPIKGEPDDNVIINYARLIVTTGTQFLFGKPLEIEVGDIEATRDPQEMWLKKCLKKNKIGQILVKMSINGGVCGHNFVKIKQLSRVTGEFPRVIVMDPSWVTPRWEHDDIDDVYEYIIAHPSIKVPFGIGGLRQPVTIIQRISRNDNDTWTIRDEELNLNTQVRKVIKVEEWPFPFAPILHNQNITIGNEFWGLADLEDDIIGVNSNLNFVISHINRIIRHHANPKTWGSGFMASQMEYSSAGTIVLPNPEARLQNLEMYSDLGSAINYYRSLKRAFHEVTQVPEVATGALESTGNLAGVALVVLYYPIVQKTGSKHLTYGPLIEDLFSRLLEVGGQGTHDVQVSWPNMLPRDWLQEAQTMAIYNTLGVSQETIVGIFGFNPELERERKQNDSKQEAPMPKVGRGTGSQAVSQTGTSVAGQGNGDGRAN